MTIKMVGKVKRQVKRCPIIEDKQRGIIGRSRDKSLEGSRMLSVLAPCSVENTSQTMKGWHTNDTCNTSRGMKPLTHKIIPQKQRQQQCLRTIDANVMSSPSTVTHRGRNRSCKDRIFLNSNQKKKDYNDDEGVYGTPKKRKEYAILKQSRNHKSSAARIIDTNTSDNNHKQQLIPKWMKLNNLSNTSSKQYQSHNNNKQNCYEPLANIIKSRYTTKVKFDLTKNREYDDHHSSSKNNNGNDGNLPSLGTTETTNLPQVQGFMNPFLFGVNNDSAAIDMDYHDDDSHSQLIFKTNNDKKSSSSLKCYNHETNQTNNSMVVFKEDRSISSAIEDVILKGKKAQYVTFQYHKASKYFLQALSKLDDYVYPESHKLRITTVALLSDTHHAMRSLEHSSDIVKMGLKHEEKGDLIKALKMYTIAFRIRRDAVGRKHPSLPILLNMIGSVQIKRGELSEAMQIFELALYGRLKDDNMKIVGKTNVNDGTRAVSMREMGKIHEMRGNDDSALEMFHSSLECVMEPLQNKLDGCCNGSSESVGENTSPCDYEKGIFHNDIRLINATDNGDAVNTTSSCIAAATKVQNEEMEVYLDSKQYSGERNISNLCAFYNLFFQNGKLVKKNKNISVHVAMTLHHIANIHSKRGHHELALFSYKAALRGMKSTLGNDHSNVAAVLGNIGNLHKEMKNYDLALDIYQDVLKIESQNLGVGHPEVVVTMHNIALIEKCRGNYKNAKQLYREVLSIQLGQKERTVKWYNSTAVSYSCLGDVEEKDGNFNAAIKAYKEALYTRTQYINKLHPDLGKLLHKLGKVSSMNGNLSDAAIYFSKALRVYDFNNIEDSRVIAVLRDQADLLGKVAFTTSTI